METEILSPEIQQVLDNVLSSPYQGAPQLAARRPYESPADWRDLWIYFLLVDRFNNPHTQPNPNAFPCENYQGGTFAGIKEKLPYLKELGVGAIWLSPVLMNPKWLDTYWGGYCINNFIRIEPRFCSDPGQARNDPAVADKEFKSLIDEAHAQGIYVILDIVLNHVANLFNYEGAREEPEWNPSGEYKIYWRDDDGKPRGDWTDIQKIPNLPEQTGIWPTEFQRNDYFRRRGHINGDITKGDFDGGLRELVTEYLNTDTSIYEVRNYLIRVYQYLIAKFDIDGYRIDTLQYIEPEFARVFGNAMREFALSIGKKNFFTFGEVWQDDKEEEIARFIGRDTEKADQEVIGIDAAIDFPVRKRLWQIAKGFAPPSDLAYHLDHRREVLRKIVSSHGEASGNYVTFLENHDLKERFHNTAYTEQTKLAITCLMTLQGIPCLYYGQEQGLEGNGDKPEFVREAMWGKDSAFSKDHELYKHIKAVSELRDREPALRYGRQYFRACSGNGTDFGYSTHNGGVLAYSRILNDREILVVANTSSTDTTTVQVVVDRNLNADGKVWQVLFPVNWTSPSPVTGTRTKYRTVEVTLRPMQVMVMR